MKKILLLLVLPLLGILTAGADPMFPYFVDITGANEYIPHTTFLENYPERTCDDYAPVSDYYQRNEERLFSFLNDVLPDRILSSRREGKTEKATYYIYSDQMLDDMISFLIIAVYTDGTIGAEYIEAKNTVIK